MWTMILLFTVFAAAVCVLNKKACNNEYIPSDDGLIDDFYVPKELRK